jgi:cytochrome c biogenesis protein CcmG, thiol:disulfide interchange protein DsbE
MTPRAVAGAPAPSFEAVTLAGDTVSLESLQGAPVLLNLWATWCAPCRRETPFLQDVHERFAPRGLQVVGVSMDTRGALRDVERFIDEFGVTYRILHDPDGRSMDLFSAIGLPATYLIGADGIILWSRVGEVREGDRVFEEALDAAVAGLAEEAAGAS